MPVLVIGNARWRFGHARRAISRLHETQLSVELKFSSLVLSIRSMKSEILSESSRRIHNQSSRLNCRESKINCFGTLKRTCCASNADSSDLFPRKGGKHSG